MKHILFACIFSYAFSAFSQLPYYKVIEVKPYLQLQNYEHYKRLVLQTSESEIDFIEGFSFAWGTAYTLQIQVRPLKHPLSDGTQFKYKLVKVLSEIKQADTSTFDLVIDSRRYYHKPQASEGNISQSLVAVNDSTYRYLDEVEIQVPEHLSTAFEELIKTGGKKKATCSFVHEKRILLVNLH